MLVWEFLNSLWVINLVFHPLMSSRRSHWSRDFQCRLSGHLLFLFLTTLWPGCPRYSPCPLSHCLLIASSSCGLLVTMETLFSFCWYLYTSPFFFLSPPFSFHHSHEDYRWLKTLFVLFPFFFFFYKFGTSSVKWRSSALHPLCQWLIWAVWLSVDHFWLCGCVCVSSLPLFIRLAV